MNQSTKVELPGLTLELVREEFVVADVIHDISYKSQTRPDGPVKTVFRRVYPVYCAPGGSMAHSGKFTGVLWDCQARQFVGYDEEFGENRCEGWPALVEFVERLVHEGQLSEVYLADRDDEGHITIHEATGGEWTTMILSDEEECW